MKISDKIKYIQEYIPQKELSVMTDVSGRYLRYVKEGKRSGAGIKSKIDSLYKTFHALEKRSYTKRRLSEPEKERLKSLQKFHKIEIKKQRTSKAGNRVTDIEIVFNIKFDSDKNKRLVLRKLYRVLKGYKFGGLFQFYTFNVLGQEIVFSPLQVSDLETFKAQFIEIFIEKSEFDFYGGSKKESSLSVINRKNVILKSVKLRIMIYR
ncbi:MAG TPA: hypothetical protein ENI61_04110 [Ignavibacteria bacterium]|nr:hypothetical protein [Ignavibacteria bacterium]